MKVDGRNMSMIRGDSESITVSCFDTNGNIIPLISGDKIFYSKRSTKKYFKKITNF